MKEFLGQCTSSIFIVNLKTGKKKRIYGLDPFIITKNSLYVFKKPITLFKGSILECINWFDNSEDNPINPARRCCI